MAKLANIQDGQLVIDPLMGSGTIPIGKNFPRKVEIIFFFRNRGELEEYTSDGG